MPVLDVRGVLFIGARGTRLGELLLRAISFGRYEEQLTVGVVLAVAVVLAVEGGICTRVCTTAGGKRGRVRAAPYLVRYSGG